jgi:hypothetical protein
LFKQQGLGELSAAELMGGQGAIPESEEHQRVGSLGLEWEVVGHRTGEDTVAEANLKRLFTAETQSAPRKTQGGKSKRHCENWEY